MIESYHKEYTDSLYDWQMIDNAVYGNRNNSARVRKYLPILAEHDGSTENKRRNQEYGDRAVFYNLTRFTLEGLNSMLFQKRPKVLLPAVLNYVEKNVDGTGTTLNQFAMLVTSEVIKKGRAGILVSYPKTEGELSRAQAQKYKATLHQVDAEQIINWREEFVDGEYKLTLVVIKESMEVWDGYKTEYQDKLKELALINNVFTCREWVKDGGDWKVIEQYTPTNAAGAVWNEIPFVFCGSKSNTTATDIPPLLDIADINLKHYCNSAIAEESVFYHGQSQAYITGLSSGANEMMKENQIYIGSKTILPVGSGEKFGFETAPPNTIVNDAMDKKIENMIGLGARFIQENNMIKTATEDDNDAKVQHSILSVIAINVSDAMERALEFAGAYMGSSDPVLYQINKNFVSRSATAQDLQAVIMGFIQGALPISDFHNWLKKYGISDEDKTLEEFSEELPDLPMVDAPNVIDNNAK